MEPHPQGVDHEGKYLVRFTPQNVQNSQASTVCLGCTGSTPVLTQQSVMVDVSGSHNVCFLGPVTECTFNIKQAQGKKNGHEKKEEFNSQDNSEQTAADHCEQLLKRRYKTTGSYIQVIPWEDEDTKHVKDIYTKLVLQTKERLNSYEDIFCFKSREGIPIKRVILNGLAGRGKSTLIDKMTYDWAVDASYALQKYKLVFVLKMNALNQCSELLDAIFEQLLDEDTDVDRTDLGSFITNNPEKVLILLDGFDETMMTSQSRTFFGSIFKILNRKIGREVFVIVSTRPSHFERLVTTKLIQKPFVDVRVEGFDLNAVVEYVERFFAEEPEKAEGLLQRIKSSNSLSDLTKSPMLILLMCILWREGSSLPDTMSQLYSQAIGYIFKRKSDALPEEISNVSIEIGKIGLHGLVDRDQLIAFPEREFKKSLLDVAIKAGILTKHKVLKGLETHNSIQFIHKTFQEFCAAKYLQSLLEEGTGTFQDTLDHILGSTPKDPREFEYLLRFCSGDNEACTNMILKALIDRLPNDQRVRKLAVDCYFEGQSMNLPSFDLVQSFITNEMSFIQMDTDCLNSYTWFLKHVNNLTENRKNVHLAKVTKMTIDMCHLPRSFCKCLAKALTAMTSLLCLTVKRCSVSVSNLQCIVSSLHSATELTTLDLSDNDIVYETYNGNAPPWFAQVQLIKNLKILHLNECSLTADSVAVLDMPDLVELTLANNEGLGGCAESWCHHFRHMTQLQKLDLSGCLLRGNDMKYVAHSLGELPHFLDLTLKENHTLGCSGAEALSYLRQMKHLEKLDMRSCSLTGEDMTHIADSPDDLPNLVELTLSKNKALGGCAASWSPKLRYLKKLQKLSIGGCSLTHVDMTYVAFSLCDLTDFVELQLIGNTSLGSSTESWADSLKSLRWIKILGLRYCSLTGEGMVYITGALSNLSMLVVLILDGNKALGSSAELWSHHLKNLRHLEELELAGCALIGKDMEYIVSSLCELSNLVELRLPSNQGLGGSASTWATHLSKMKHLQKFDLGFCSVTGTDMTHLIGALASCFLPNLIEFKVYSNKALSGSAALWSGQLQGMTKVKILNFGKCCFTGEDMTHVAGALGQMLDLIELVLYGNKALSGSVGSWCHHLKHIKKLDLSGCSLTGQDMKCLIISCPVFYYSTSEFSYDVYA